MPTLCRCHPSVRAGVCVGGGDSQNRTSVMLVYTVGLLRNIIRHCKEVVIASMYVCATGH